MGETSFAFKTEKVLDIIAVLTVPYIFLFSILYNYGYFSEIFLYSLPVLLILWLCVCICNRKKIVFPKIYRFLVMVAIIVVSTSTLSTYIYIRKREMYNIEWTYFVYTDAAVLIIAMLVCMCRKKKFALGLRLISTFVLATGVWGYFDYVIKYLGYIETDPRFAKAFRPYSIYQNPIPGGQIILMFLWIPFWMGKNRTSRKDNIINAVIRVIVYVPFIVLTRSRSILIGLVFVTAVWGIINRKAISDAWNNLSAKRKRIVASILGVATFVVVSGAIILIAPRFEDLKNTESYIVRTNYMKYTLEQVADSSILRILFGHGSGSCKDMIVDSPYFVEPYNICDNAYMSMLYEWGIIAIIAVIVIDIFAFKTVLRFIADKSIATYCAYAVIACVFPIFFYEAQMWLTVGILMAIVVAGGVDNEIKA